MPITRIGDFLRADDIGITPMLGIESSNIQACIAEVKRLGVKGIFGCSAFDFRENNLDFLNDLPELIQVWLWEVSLQDVGGIYALQNLELFLVHNRTQGIDFSRLQKLKQVIWHYQPKDTGLAQLPDLEQLDVWHFNPKSKSFAGCPVSSDLKHLEFNWANPSTLDGLPQMPHLRELQLHYCRSLTSLEGLDRIAPNLERLIVASCKQCKDTSAIGKLTKLKHVFINKPARAG
jgi:hypothetical protein